MSPARKASLREWISIIAGLCSISAVAWGLVRGGQISEKVTSALSQSVQKDDLKDWIAETASLNTNGWKAANFTTIFNANRNHKDAL